MSNKSTQFKAGYDAKRFVPVNMGLVEFHKELAGLLRLQSLDAVSFLVNTMNNPKAALKLRVVAANQILDRGLGKPVDRVVLSTLDAGRDINIETLDTKSLELMIANLSDKPQVIDAEYEEVN